MNRCPNRKKISQIFNVNILGMDIRFLVNFTRDHYLDGAEILKMKQYYYQKNYLINNIDVFDLL